ncbi:MAG: amidase, partial [Bacteroidota bacterium]
MRQSSTKKGLKYRIFQWLAIPLLIACGAMANEMASEEVTPQEAIAALKVAGLEMNDEEIDMLLPTLEEYREAYAEMRETPIDNGVSPSLEFDPRPEGFIMPTDSFFQYPRPVTAPSPLTSDSSALAFEGITILATRLRLGQITSVELTSYFLNRLRKYDEQLHCVISLTEELALEQAARADSELAAGKDRGILHGIPYGAKDLFATKRYRTTWGATPYRDQAFDYDAAAIEKMEEAGAILVAKLSLGALAWGDVWYGEMTRNPWDPATGSSGSSAGSASAVSAGLVPFALGTETLGSIVSPSTTCGVTGLRPTFG